VLFGLVIGGMNPSPARSRRPVPAVLPDLVAGFGKACPLLYAVLLIAAIVALPNGVAGALGGLAARLRRQ
jgi:branched-chain amino acid transport system permease protein